MGYPGSLKSLTYDPNFIIKGVCLDLTLGNVIKLGKFAQVCLVSLAAFIFIEDIFVLDCGVLSWSPETEQDPSGVAVSFHAHPSRAHRGHQVPPIVDAVVDLYLKNSLIVESR